MNAAPSFDSDFSLTIDGAAVPTAAHLAIVNPASGEWIADAPDASAADLDRAVAAARRALPAWRSAPIATRQAAVGAIAAALMRHLEAFARLLTREQGKPLDAARTEIQAAAYWCAEFARMDLPVTVLEDTAETRVEVRRLPLGVVGAIVPWNFPLVLAIWKLAPALLAGNTVVLKPSPFTPLSTLKLGEVLRPALPPGVLNVLSGGDALGPWMSAHPDIDKISFTGSTPTGRGVMQSAAPNLKRLTLELGGNDAAIVLPDVDVDALAPTLFWGAFLNNAQFCLAIKRLYLHESIYERMAQRLAALARETKMGDGMADGVQLGPVQNARQYQRLCALAQDCADRGYRFLSGGVPAPGNGYFFPVTLVDNPPDEARVVREEPFGPILPLLKFSDVDEVIRRANDSEYGLGASVWSGDEARALDIAGRLQAGSIWVNEIHSLSPHRPMAGHKQSGIGVENGTEGLLQYTVPQTIALRKR